MPFDPLRSLTRDPDALAAAAAASGLSPGEVAAVLGEARRLIEALKGPPARYHDLRALLVAFEAACSRTA